MIKQDRENAESVFHGDMLNDSTLRQELIYGKVIPKVKDDLRQYGYSDIEIADILVKYLYGLRNNKHKDILWVCYGDLIVENLKVHFKPKTKDIQCVDCGEWFSVSTKNNRACRCEACQYEINNYHSKLRMRKQRNDNVTLSNL